MLQSLSSLLNDDGRAVQIVLVVVVLIVLIGLLYVLYRVLFAHRLRAPGGTRVRGSRLGIVDVFGLDGQRQLVIVRRDNVEHLLMIGGPNDVVVEGNIVRSATNGARDVAKPAAAPPNEQPTELPPAPFPRPAAPAAVANVMKRAFSLRTEPPLATPAEQPARPEEVAVVEPIVKPEPPRRAPEPARNTVIPLTSRAPADPAPAPRPPVEARPAPAPVEPPPPPKAAPEPPLRRAPPPKPAEPPAPRPALPSPIAPLRPRPLPAEAARPNPPPAPVEPPPKPAEAPPPVAPAPVATVAAEAAPADKPGQRKEEAFYDLESLEAEMARLLGRDG